MAYAGGAIAAIESQRRRMEEEETVGYGADELAEGWEFKILRSVMGRFDDPAVFRAVVEEEARAGWQLLEKFDDNRIRFKRPPAARALDDQLPLGVDPYRTRYGISEGQLAFAIIGGILGVVATLVVLVGALR